jgi:hypothetical protein
MGATHEPETPPEHSARRWPPLGRLLVDGGLITEAQLEQALAEQRRDGARLGDVVLRKGWISRLALAAIVARQHGLELSAASPAEPTEAPRPAAWKPLGQLLVEKGLLTRIQIQQTIAEQRDTGRRLGEILVARNWLTPIMLMRVLDEQQGLGLAGQSLEVHVSSPEEVSEQYHVERRHDRGWELVHTSPTYFDATDVAFDLLDGDPYVALQIMRVAGDERERVWSFDPRQSRAESSLDVYGYPVTVWDTSDAFDSRAAAGVDR